MKHLLSTDTCCKANQFTYLFNKVYVEIDR